MEKKVFLRRRSHCLPNSVGDLFRQTCTGIFFVRQREPHIWKEIGELPIFDSPLTRRDDYEYISVYVRLRKKV